MNVISATQPLDPEITTVDDPEVVAEVTIAFQRYEAALMADDVDALDKLFHASPTTVRYGVGEVLYGIDAIRAFRLARGGSPRRTLTAVAIHTYGRNFAAANAEFRRGNVYERCRQSQSWVRFVSGWKIVSAHVSIERDGS